MLLRQTLYDIMYCKLSKNVLNIAQIQEIVYSLRIFQFLGPTVTTFV